jgi:hypothetical protein
MVGCASHGWGREWLDLVGLAWTGAEEIVEMKPLKFHGGGCCTSLKRGVNENPFVFALDDEGIALIRAGTLRAENASVFICFGFVSCRSANNSFSYA